MPSAGELAALFMALRRTAAEEDRSLLEVSAGVGLAFLTSARKVSGRDVLVPYREDWKPLQDEGLAAYARRVGGPYRRAISRHLDSGEASRTERLIDRLAAWRERVRSAPSGNNDSELRTNEKRSPVERGTVLDSLVDLISSSNWTYLVIVAIAYFDAIIPIVPSETAVIAAGVLAGTGDLELSLVIIAGAVGAFTGDNCLPPGPEIRSADSRLVFRGENGQKRHAWAGTRARPVRRTTHLRGALRARGRTAVTVSSGVLRMRWARFAMFDGIAAIAWASYAALIGYLGGKAFEDNPIWASSSDSASLRPCSSSSS